MCRAPNIYEYFEGSDIRPTLKGQSNIRLRSSYWAWHECIDPTHAYADRTGPFERRIKSTKDFTYQSDEYKWSIGPPARETKQWKGK